MHISFSFMTISKQHICCLSFSPISRGSQPLKGQNNSETTFFGQLNHKITKYFFSLAVVNVTNHYRDHQNV